jgi:hypothetical protein
MPRVVTGSARVRVVVSIACDGRRLLAPRERALPLTPLQHHLIDIYCALEHAREELPEAQFRAFIWIAADVIGIEAARVVVAEATAVLAGVKRDAA